MGSHDGVRLVGLVSSYREGWLLEPALRSLARAVDQVYMLDAPIGDGCPGEESQVPAEPERIRLWRETRSYDSDAAKRTELIRRVRGLERQRPLWGVWLDGDELLLWGEYLRDHVRWAAGEDEQREGLPAFKIPLRIVEYDGSTALAHGRCIRVDLIESYVLSLAAAMMPAIDPSLPVPLGNIAVWKPGELNEDRTKLAVYPSPHLALERPPLHGEPHILHRSLLRGRGRDGIRLHKQEAEAREVLIREGVL